MKHHELSREQVKNQLAALRPRRAKRGQLQAFCTVCFISCWLLVTFSHCTGFVLGVVW